MSVAALLIALGALGSAAAPVQANPIEFELTWGKDVSASTDGAGAEICTVAYNCSEGATGSRGGEFNYPKGVAIDTIGNVYVADLNNDRVQKFDSAGNFLSAWGKDVIAGGGTGFEVCTVGATCKAGVEGGEAGAFRQPAGITTDTIGNVYVVDGNNQRVQKFDSAGNFQLAWGKDVIAGGGTGFEVCTVPATCKGGGPGGLGGEFVSPVGDIATDTAAHVYVLDSTGASEYSNNRVQRFSSSGNFQRAWGKDVIAGGGTGFEVCTVAATCKSAEFGGLGGEFSFPTGIAADASGNVYVSERDSNRIQKFTSSGAWIRAWGKDVIADGGTDYEVCTIATTCKAGLAGGLGGELSDPEGMAVDATGNVYVAEWVNYRIQAFDSSGEFLETWGKDVDTHKSLGFEVCTIRARCKAGSFTVGGYGGEISPRDVAVNAVGNVYSTEHGFYGQRVQKFRRLPVVASLSGTTLELTVPGPGRLSVADARAKRNKLKRSSTTASGPGPIEISLRLTKAAKEKLRAKESLSVKAAITFKPTGSTALTQIEKLTIKK